MPVTHSEEDLVNLTEHDSLRCSICKSEYESLDITVTTPCSHKFHKVCIISWLTDHHTCPLCRRPCTPSRLLTFDSLQNAEATSAGVLGTNLVQTAVEVESLSNVNKKPGRSVYTLDLYRPTGDTKSNNWQRPCIKRISPISSLLIGEMFPLEYRGLGSAMTATFGYFCAFLGVKTFVDFQELLGLHGAFWLYASISCTGLLFIVIVVPETKGKHLDEMDSTQFPFYIKR